MTGIIPGAEPWSHEGGPHGVLVLHGFTGNPGSMRGLAEALAAAGFAVELPLLPGHGTSVDDMVPTRFADWAAAAESAYLALAGRCDEVVVAGLSMGGTLAGLVTARNPKVAGLIAINGLYQPPDEAFVTLLRTCLAQGLDRMPGIGSDIAKPGAIELAYPDAPIEPMLSMMEALPGLVEELGRIRCPVLILTSPQDHIVPPASSDLLAETVSGPVERVMLERSYHVATLDYDAELIFERAVEFALKAVS